MVYSFSMNQYGRDQETYQIALLAEIWCQVAYTYLRDLLALMPRARCLANQHSWLNLALEKALNIEVCTKHSFKYLD